jgi:hypothetical protein
MIFEEFVQYGTAVCVVLFVIASCVVGTAMLLEVYCSALEDREEP